MIMNEACEVIGCWKPPLGSANSEASLDGSWRQKITERQRMGSQKAGRDWTLEKPNESNSSKASR
jgi:hypothetical protein